MRIASSEDDRGGAEEGEFERRHQAILRIGQRRCGKLIAKLPVEVVFESGPRGSATTLERIMACGYLQGVHDAVSTVLKRGMINGKDTQAGRRPGGDT